MIKRLLPLLLLIALSSCAVYTIGDGKAAINAPTYSDLPETRIRLIHPEWFEKEDEEETQEEESIVEIEIIEEEIIAKEEEEVLNLAEVALPYNYRIIESDVRIETELNALKLVLIPLSEDAIIDSVQSSIRELDLDFAILTGSRVKIAEFVEKAGYNAVLFEGSAILYKTAVDNIDSNSASFILNEDERVDIAAINTFQGLPSSSEELLSFLESLGKTDPSIVNITEEKSIIALSTSKPSTDDWIPFTAYEYRTSYTSDESEGLNEAGYSDVYRATHYTAETDSGITRESGDIYERLDFIYSYGALPLSSTTLSVAGMTNRVVYAELLI